MTSKPLSAGLVALAALACGLGEGCGGPTEPHGSPVLTKVYWSANGSQQVVWSPANDPDPSQVSSAPPFCDEIDFVFDRQLDGSRIETIETIDGAAVAVPKSPAAIEATWPDMTKVMSTPPFGLVVDYNSAPIYGDNSVFVFARPETPGLPAGDTVTFELVLSSLTSAYGDIATAPSSISIKTSPFAIALAAPTGAVATSFEIPLAATNRLPLVPADGTSPSVHVAAAGADVPYKLLADASLGSRWYLAPADCLGAWPANTTFDVTIDATLADAFGAPLAQGATGTFATGAASGIARAGTCPAPDGGAGDAVAPVDSSSDAASDADADLDAGRDAPEGDAGVVEPSHVDGGTGDAQDVPASFGDATDAAPEAG